LKDDSRHNFLCYTKILDRWKFIYKLCSFVKFLVIKVYIEKISKPILEWNKYNLKKLEERSLDFEDCATQIHSQDLHTKNWYVIMYYIPYKMLYEKWCTPKLLNRLNCESKGENNGRKRSWVRSLAYNTLTVKKACWNSEMGIRTSEKWVNYPHGPT
jgi:hypothetical protein